ncbi:MAG: MATE family efflux transporter [Planctomycetota bacterium]
MQTATDATAAPAAAAAAEENRSWWTRPAGGREVMVVATPLVVSTLSWTIMTFVDRMFLAQVSGESMSAAFTGGTVWFAFLSIALGTCSYTNTFVAQYHGGRRRKRIGPAVWAGVWIALLCSPLALAMTLLAEPVFRLAKHPPSLEALEISYFSIICYGGPALLLGASLSAFYSGRGRTDIVMWVDGAFALVNLVLDYLLIFGKFGLPEMGIEGAAWGTAIAMWLKAATFAVMVFGYRNRRLYNTGDYRGGWELLGRLTRFGLPGGLQMMLDVAGFSIFILLVSRLGELEAEATGMAFSISSVAFMPAWGLGMAAGILVGQHLGENRDDLAARATWTTLTFSLGYMGFVSALYVLFPSMFLVGFFREGGDEAYRQQVWDTGVVLLRFIAAYNLLDAAAMVFINALKGAGDTRFISAVSLVLASCMAAATWIAVEPLGRGIYTCWTLIAAWVWLQGFVFLLRFLGGKWRSMRVVEPEVAGEGPDEPAEPAMEIDAPQPITVAEA